MKTGKMTTIYHNREKNEDEIIAEFILKEDGGIEFTKGSDLFKQAIEEMIEFDCIEYMYRDKYGDAKLYREYYSKSGDKLQLIAGKLYHMMGYCSSIQYDDGKYFTTCFSGG